MSTELAVIAAAEHAIRLVCAVPGIRRHWSCAWLRTAPRRAERTAEREAVSAKIREIVDGSKGRYGAPGSIRNRKPKAMRSRAKPQPSS